MDRQVTRVVVLLWATVFFGLILPGHRRGAIPLPGVEAVDSGWADRSGKVDVSNIAEATCPMCVGWPGYQESPNDPPEGGPAKCALCYLMATLLPPPPLTLGPGPLTLLDLLRPLAPDPAPEAAPERRNPIRGPPERVPRAVNV